MWVQTQETRILKKLEKSWKSWENIRKTWGYWVKKSDRKKNWGWKNWKHLKNWRRRKKRRSKIVVEKRC